MNIPTNEWSNLDQLFGAWTQLERDDDGHFLYEPCDGNTPGIIISRDSITLIHQIEMPTYLSIKNYKISDKSITLKGSTENLESNFKFKIVEPNSKFILLKWEHKLNSKFGVVPNRGKKIITREILKSAFRLVKDSCDTEKIPNQVFLPVKYD